ncbi:hypothetical protein GCM10009557_62290 [Virgisporangium ochraceum]|uniref:Uncharacterized protein n=1 Tax=Virgisporangium ochraceum TaxID=65505 RepID=A0A8J4ED11_9ACTN|nr:hypothetical protein [Virgisporangium ochraceum]GIJ71035.1 hypothetical protein Voc01_059520 [Virgisporangium ochraceum]
MGIWKDAFVAPRQATAPDAEALGRLVLDLARSRIVRTPWTLVAGRVDVNETLLWSDGAVWQAVAGDPLTDARVLAKGDEVLDVLPALARAPVGDEDVAVIFASLDFDNPRILEHYWYEDARTVLVCYGLSRPQARWLVMNQLMDEPGGPTQQAGVCIVHTFKFGEHDPCPAIDEVARRHFGPDLVHGLTLH